CARSLPGYFDYW
nr:immunoglobulin heavy chain junction region [Mus musculus]